MIVAQRLRWGFALAAPTTNSSEKFELVHVPGLVDGLQYCRIQLADREVFVVFLAGAALGDARVHALAARFPEAAFAVVFDDANDRARAFALGMSASTAAAAVAIAKYNGTLTDETRWPVEVDAVAYEVAVDFKDAVWTARVRCQTDVL